MAKREMIWRENKRSGPGKGRCVVDVEAKTGWPGEASAAEWPARGIALWRRRFAGGYNSFLAECQETCRGFFLVGYFKRIDV